MSRNSPRRDRNRSKKCLPAPSCESCVSQWGNLSVLAVVFICLHNCFSCGLCCAVEQVCVPKKKKLNRTVITPENMKIRSCLQHTCIHKQSRLHHSANVCTEIQPPPPPPQIRKWHKVGVVYYNWCSCLPSKHGSILGKRIQCSIITTRCCVRVTMFFSSSFVVDPSQVKAVRAQLVSNRKIASATHNIVAFRWEALEAQDVLYETFAWNIFVLVLGKDCGLVERGQWVSKLSGWVFQATE